jgi:hypothetical protein
LIRFIAAIFLIGLTHGPSRDAQAQTSPPASLRLYLDCNGGCDRTFIRTEISLVDFVTERTAADVHLLVTSERNGSGGRTYTLNFIGLRSFSALSDTLIYNSHGTDTDDEERQGLTHSIEAGLVRYAIRTALAEKMTVSLFRELGDQVADASTEADPWNYWVFSLGGNGSYRGEESSNNLQARWNLSANRTTEIWKVRVAAFGRYQERNFNLDDGRTVTSTTESGSLWLFGVRSLGEHWSLGGTIFANSSSRDNTKASVTIGPAIEYNLFPYSESTRREFRFEYGVRWDRVSYEEITIFDLTEESVLKQSLQAELDLTQPWGDLGFNAELSHLLTNFDRSLTGSYRLQLDANSEVRIVRGLTLSVGASYELIRDQLFLPLSDVAEEDVLLGTRRLPTGFDFSVSFGLNFRFGSIFNNVVNPRFGR